MDDPHNIAAASSSADRRVLVVRLGAMGDVIHALPAVDIIRQAQPDLRIGWVIERRWVPLLCADGYPLSGDISPERPLVNSVHVVDTRAWRKSIFSPQTFRAISELRTSLRAAGYDVAIDFQGAIKSAIVARMSGAQRIVGFSKPREGVATMFYSHTIDTTMAHVVDQNFALARDLVGDARVPPSVCLPVDIEAEAWVTAQLKRLGIGGFAILAPTAGWKAKEWPVENFGKLAWALAERGITSLINFGPGEERIAQEVSDASKGAAKPFDCNLSRLIALTRRAALFVGGDTGPMHLAAALRIPVVALFGPTDPARNGPYTSRAKVLRSVKSVTSYSHVEQRDEGLASITPDEVIAAAEALL